MDTFYKSAVKIAARPKAKSRLHLSVINIGISVHQASRMETKGGANATVTHEEYLEKLNFHITSEDPVLDVRRVIIRNLF